MNKYIVRCLKTIHGKVFADGQKSRKMKRTDRRPKCFRFVQALHIVCLVTFPCVFARDACNRDCGMHLSFVECVHFSMVSNSGTNPTSLNSHRYGSHYLNKFEWEVGGCGKIDVFILLAKEWVFNHKKWGSDFTFGATPTGAVRGMPNLLVVDIPLVESRNDVKVTTMRNTLFDACINAYVPGFGRPLVEAIEWNLLAVRPWGDSRK